MKKAYSKPQIVFDSFELSQSIAGTCEEKTNHAYGNCALQIEEPGFNQTIFIDGVSACLQKPVDGQYNGLCYHTPSEGYNLFSS